MDFISVAQVLLVIAMLINLVLAVRDTAKHKPFNIYYVPSNARLVQRISWSIFIVAGVVTFLNIVKVLPTSLFWTIWFVWLFFDNWTSVFYRLGRLFGKSVEQK